MAEIILLLLVAAEPRLSMFNFVTNLNRFSMIILLHKFASENDVQSTGYLCCTVELGGVI